MNLTNRDRFSSWPAEITLEDLTALAKARLGARYLKVAKFTYGGGSQVEVQSICYGYHGKRMKREACYSIN